MSPTQREKMQAHAEHVLDAFIMLRTTHMMLEPLLFDGEVITRWGSKKRGLGFRQIKHTMLHSCVLQIAKIALDNDDRTPSVTKLVKALDTPALVSDLREAYAVWHIEPTGSDEPEVIELIQRSERREEAERRVQFDSLVTQLRDGWEDLKKSPAMKSCGVMRDKVITHTELHLHDGEHYRPVDVSALGLKFGDLRIVIESLRRLVDLISLVFRGSNFAFDELDAQLAVGRDHFWKSPGDHAASGVVGSDLR